MGVGDFGLEKLKIIAYKDDGRSKKVEPELVVMFNPESYSRNFGHTYTTKGAVSGLKKRTLSSSTGGDLKLKLIFTNFGTENVGLSVGPDILSVEEQIKKFKNVTFEKKDKIHRPYYLVVKWSKLEFKCFLSSASISYTRFDRSGNALRAEVDATFVDDFVFKQADEIAKFQSPDVTHSRLIKPGDTLPLMADEIYEDPNEYIRVARANKLNSVRGLKTGALLQFPAITE